VKLVEWLRAPEHRLDIVAGLVDGILNALILAAGRIVGRGGLTLALVGKLAAVTACTTGFVFFVAHYSQLRSELVRSARELNLRSHGHLATTQLGRQVLEESLWGATVASIFGVVGSVIPLVIGLAVASFPLAGLAITVVLLGLLGWSLGSSVFGSPLLWACGLMVGGVAIAALGVKLDVLS